jgi:site-specific DNA-methyltransferase (adenine-specific)
VAQPFIFPPEESISIINADAVRYARRLAAWNYLNPDQAFYYHALLCDPPYHLTSITKRFGKKNSAPAKYGQDGAFSRASSGFMGKEWDGGDIAFDPATWRAFKRILYPGAFGMAFAGSRGWHRMAVAIEDAGFIIHPTIFLWGYGSGFPKATRIDTQIDRADGYQIPTGELITENNSMSGVISPRHNYDAQSELAQIWQGHRYGLQAMKPATEPIIVFQKPYAGRPIDNMIETGAGALNIDGGRIGTDKMLNQAVQLGSNGIYSKMDRNNSQTIANGRWPANFILVHTPDCRITGYRESDSYVINRFDDGMKPFGDGAGHEYSTEDTSGGLQPVWECVEGCAVKALDKQGGNSHIVGEGDTSRFFYQAGWSYEVAEQLLNADPVKYQAKASRSERDAGLENIEPTTPERYGEFKGTEEHAPNKQNLQRNPHPTLKPIDLTRYLATLLLPPDHYAPRRIFIPFAGVASEVIGAYQAQWETVTGLELESEYVPIAQQRLKYWIEQGIQLPLF